ncbi:GNAT family protein [Nocardioides panacihumi]|uniref:GNAT family protein n=1 Tax=Nocardioides panacihumi TaxID=400774 RepID=A0ABN2RM58_9ACTN
MPVRLRPVTETDLPALDGAESPYENFGPRAPRSAAHDPSLNADLGGLAVVDDSGALLGNVSWVWQRWGPNAQSRNPMIGIWLTSAARGRGAGTEAQRQLVDLFFLHTAVNRIEAHTDVENLAEQRALEKVGFQREGVIRGAQWREGAYRDGYLYSILRAESGAR